MGTEYKLMSRDSFEEVDDQNKAVLNKFWENCVSNHKLILKTGDICLITRAVNSLGLANDSQVQVTNVRTHSIEVITMGDNEGRTVRLPCITFKFRMPY